ncbi:hypothetical protein AYL99_08089 [Fonsecaea erecta]|uniref:F-box domain-containing protein n=1 Tax=Fonsecaea erecta TaxID=1367422 RepID=A0A178ZCZ2_9EURO|nr:hypothetical protein AYL99_08089 [Fonsecaea erecta]OAP57351.1 hypothetical protein AYL99_08089 [Fonsecaea erecta]
MLQERETELQNKERENQGLKKQLDESRTALSDMRKTMVIAGRKEPKPMDGDVVNKFVTLKSDILQLVRAHCNAPITPSGVRQENVAPELPELLVRAEVARHIWANFFYSNNLLFGFDDEDEDNTLMKVEYNFLRSHQQTEGLVEWRNKSINIIKSMTNPNRYRYSDDCATRIWDKIEGYCHHAKTDKTDREQAWQDLISICRAAYDVALLFRETKIEYQWEQDKDLLPTLATNPDDHEIVATIGPDPSENHEIERIVLDDHLGLLLDLFMHPAPSEASQNATSVEQTQQLPSPSTQHGLPDIEHEASGGLLSTGSPREPTSDLEEPSDNVSIRSGGTQRGRSSNTRWISSRNSSSQGSPGSRIDEYERAHTQYRKPSDGIIFQVIPSAKDKDSRVSIENFPNEVLTHILSHLPPETLSSMSLVSRRFHKLITTPHAWRIAFARYFPGAEALDAGPSKAVQESISEVDRAQRRSFTRLSALSSWRSEYILRTRLLRSLGRGRPAIEAISRSGASRHASSAAAAAVTTYASGLWYPVSHLHATFGVGLNKKQPLFMHGAVEQGVVCVSDPASGKPGSWGLTDFNAFHHFADQFPGELPYGLGPGNMVGMTNVMDVSQPYGKVYGEACPGGRVFYTSTSEQRGRFVSISSTANHQLGIPETTMNGCAVCSVWIAKSESVLKATSGIFGFLAGFSNGVLAAYALGVNPVHDRWFEKGELTAKWVLCPGVPIIAICVDERVSARRLSARRIWATVLNALGEVFYLTDAPARPDFVGKASSEELDRLAWRTGRSVQWSLVEATRRVAKPDPFGTAKVDGSYSPRISSDECGLSKDQIVAETKEVEAFLRYKPKHFQSICNGWDMQRRLMNDFAGDDGANAGESVFVVECGLSGNSGASVRRFTRCITKITVDSELDSWPTIQSTIKPASIFGTSSSAQQSPHSSPGPRSIPRSRTSSQDDIVGSRSREVWHISNFSFAEHRNIHISASASDESEFATLNVNEDPLLGMSGGSNTSSPLASPLGHAGTLSSSSEIPGHRARLFGIGTMSGIVMLWDMRASLSPSPEVINTVSPLRVIYTKSPQIASLALTSLYVVHGGNEGLVQAWDPLASTTEPVRTLNSRFSDRARRRIAQAEASVQGVGNNYYAAGAIVLDPDPTVLRGMVSLGSHVRYWSYSSTAADAYKTRKRGQLRRRSERGSNSTPASQKVSATGRGLIKDYISNERHEMEREKLVRQKELERLSGRFGTNILGEGASEEELLAYASMLSEEAFSSDELKRKEAFGGSSIASPKPSQSGVDRAADADLEEAIRLSLLESEQVSSSPAMSASDFDIPIRYTKSSRHGTPSRKGKAGGSKAQAGAEEDDDDLEFALQLSLAEEQSRMAMDEDFPMLSKSTSGGSEGSGKGKGKSRRR